MARPAAASTLTVPTTVVARWGHTSPRRPTTSASGMPPRPSGPTSGSSATSRMPVGRCPEATGRSGRRRPARPRSSTVPASSSTGRASRPEPGAPCTNGRFSTGSSRTRSSPRCVGSCRSGGPIGRSSCPTAPTIWRSPSPSSTGAGGARADTTSIGTARAVPTPTSAWSRSSATTATSLSSSWVRRPMTNSWCGARHTCAASTRPTAEPDGRCFPSLCTQRRCSPRPAARRDASQWRPRARRSTPTERSAARTSGAHRRSTRSKTEPPTAQGWCARACLRSPGAPTGRGRRCWTSGAGPGSTCRTTPRPRLRSSASSRTRPSWRWLRSARLGLRTCQCGWLRRRPRVWWTGPSTLRSRGWPTSSGQVVSPG